MRLSILIIAICLNGLAVGHAADHESAAGREPGAAKSGEESIQRSNVALLKIAEDLAQRSNSLLALSEAQASRAAAESSRIDAALSEWQAQARRVDAILRQAEASATTGRPSATSIAALCISLLALFFTTRNFRRKAGIFIRGGYVTSSGIEGNDVYVSRVLLENLKDRAVTIFRIYLRVGFNYYITLEDFEDSPLILKAYETYHEQYGAIQFYGINLRRIGLNSLLTDHKIPKRLVLSTSEGKYLVPKTIRRWDPIADFFRNHMTAVIKPVRVSYKGKDIGANVRFVVEFLGEEEQSEITFIHPDDYRLKKFNSFQLTKESLESAQSLEVFLREQRDAGKLVCREFKIHTLDAWRQRTAEHYSDRTIEAKYVGFLRYHALGRIATLLSDRQLAKQNAKRREGTPGAGT